MGKLTIGQKAQRVLRLLYGLRNRRVAEALSVYGFTERDLEEGWTLLRTLTTGRLRTQNQPPDPKLYDQLDAWENHWFPIANASLRFRYPDVHAWLFMNLAQTEGLEVVVSVGTFLERLRKLPDADLPQAREARTLLAQRGLNEATVAEARGLLEKLRRTSELEPARSPTPQENLVHEEALWNWYLEWSEIARTAIHDRRLLRALGFLQITRTRVIEEEVDEDDEMEGEVVVLDDLRPSHLELPAMAGE